MRMFVCMCACVCVFGQHPNAKISYLIKVYKK